jgi:sodium-independent sulfate anion transporter 11
MIALGVGTILGSLFSSMPVTASFGRSSVQAASGAKTPLINIYGGLFTFRSVSKTENDE